jgi:bacillopeptidase F (M6 metalloprotease family)
VKTDTKITVEVRFKAEAQAGVSADATAAAKARLESGVNTYWNNTFMLEVTDPKCGKKTIAIEYKIVWVTSGQHYTIKIHDAYPREGVTGDVMDVSKTTSDWVYAHEFGHCIGLPDEYSYVSGSTETVKYIKPDGSLDATVSAPYNGKDSAADDTTIMAAYNNTTTLARHGWSVAIEVETLLTAKIGRNIECNIKYGFSS